MRKKSSDKNRHVVAWINKAEWDQVLEYLYSKDPALQKYALHRVSAWKGRYSNNTPVAVEGTAELVRCQVLDKSGQLDGDDLVLLYGMALVRFVNLITERKQGFVARPLRSLASELKIPEWIVDLRHDFTHHKLPTLNWCRKGCDVVLEWLQQQYWSKQLGGGLNWDSQSEEGDDEEEELKRQEDKLIARQKEIENYKRARELLISFEKERYQTFDGLEDKEKGLWASPSADMTWILAQIKHLAVECSDTLIDVLMEDGFLVPTVEQLESLDYNISEDYSSTAPRIPNLFLCFWLPLLKMLNSASFIHVLLEKLFTELQQLSKEPDNHHRSFYISAWISELLLCNTKRSSYQFETKGQRRPRTKHRIFVNRIQLRWQQLLSACLDAPCVSTPHLLQLILDDMEHPLPVETRQKLLQLCSIYTQGTHSGGVTSTERRDQHQPIYTLESLNEKMQQHSRHQPNGRRAKASSDGGETFQDLSPEIQAEKAELLKGSPWQVCTDKVQWKNFPLGKVPGQSEDPSCLMVDNYSTITAFDQPVEMEGTSQHSVPGVSVPQRTSQGLPWTHSDVSKLKLGLQLF